MGKHEPLTAKAIGKRIKSKGLQKLKFYCQMCQKQCRDANGFKCHLTSEAHQRQLLLFAENPNRYMDEFSSEFMKDFLHLLKRRYSTKRVLANQVYQEYIRDRNHLHMNSTRWCTLTGFVKWMGRKGICHVENNEKGWFITYIDRDPETLLRNENKAKKEKLFRDDDERQAKLIQEQIERGKLSEMEYRLKNGQLENNEDIEKNHNNEDDDKSKRLFKKESDEQKITFSLASTSIKKPKLVVGSSSIKSPLLIDNKSSNLIKKEDDNEMDQSSTSQKIKSTSNHLERKDNKKLKKKSALDEIIEEQERWKAKQAQKLLSKTENNSSNSKIKPESISWMQPGIIVRIICKELGSKYYQKKAEIKSIESPYISLIKLLNNGDLLKIDERHLETVVPTKPGTKVMILRGLYRSKIGKIVKIDEKNEKVLIQIDNASIDEPIPFNFDDVSKLAD